MIISKEEKMKRILFSIVAFLLVATASSFAGMKVGYVDTQAVFDKSKLGQKYQDIVREYYNNRKKILDADAADIEAQTKEFEKQKSAMTEKARKEREEALRRKIDDFNKKRADFTNEINRKNEELSKEFDQALIAVLKEISKKEKISIVLNKSVGIGPKAEVPVILYAEDGLDLTSRVVAELDKKWDSKQQP